jgi:negative regulator of sigma E activity
VVEPGVVRDELLRRRIVMEDGVSLDQARVVSVTLDADLVLAGYVYDLEDGAGAPVSNFSAMVIDRKTGRMVWQSTSHDKGNDSETLFGLRRVTTAPLLTCRMAREVIDGMTGARSLPSR